MKTKEHKLTNNHPIVATLIFALIGILTTQFLAGMINIILAHVIPAMEPLGPTNPIGVVIAAVVTLALVRFWYKNEYAGAILKSTFNWQCLVILVAYALFIGGSAVSAFTQHLKLSISTAGICTALFAGILEETLFRGVIISILMRKYKDGSCMVPLMISSVLFGVVHLTNIFSGAGVAVSFLQLVSACCVGIALGGIYILTGNIIIPMAIHTFHDIYALSIPNNTNESGVIAERSIGLTDLLGLIPPIILATVVIIILCRPSSKKTVAQVWNRKWSVPGTN